MKSLDHAIIGFCDDDPDRINEVAFGGISEIESLLDSIRERQGLDERTMRGVLIGGPITDELSR